MLHSVSTSSSQPKSRDVGCMTEEDPPGTYGLHGWHAARDGIEPERNSHILHDVALMQHICRSTHKPNSQLASHSPPPREHTQSKPGVPERVMGTLTVK